MTVYFIGAGPGDPELITVKGQRLLRSCPVILYAGSLVPEAVLEGHSAEQVINTAKLHLDEIIELIRQADDKGQDVARVHSGDPSLYGAIGEQIRHLRRLGIAFEIIPGGDGHCGVRCPAGKRTDSARGVTDADPHPLCEQVEHARGRGIGRLGAPRCDHGHPPGRGAPEQDRY